MKTLVLRREDIAAAEDRFWKHVDKTDTHWYWTGATVKGYGMFSLKWRKTEKGWRCTTVRAHRFAWEALVGPIAPGMTIDHRCLVKNCVNPACCEEVTNGENARRGNYLGEGLCKKGKHLMVGKNIIIRPSKPGERECRACANDRRRK